MSLLLLTAHCLRALPAINSGLCGSGYAVAASSLLSLQGCIASGGLSMSASPDFALTVAQSFGGLSDVCAGGSPGEHVLAPLARVHAALGVAGLRTPILGCDSDGSANCAAGCRPSSLTGCALGDRSVEAPLVVQAPTLGRRRLQQLSDPTFRACPQLQSFNSCATAAGAAVDPLSAGGPTPDDGGASVYDGTTTNASRALAGYELALNDLSASLNLNRSVTDALRPSWQARDRQAVAAYTASNGPVLVTVSLCHAWVAWLAGCAVPPLFVDTSRQLCVYDSKVDGSFYSGALGLYVVRRNPALASLPFGGHSCSPHATRSAMLLVGASSFATNATNATTPVWHLLDPQTGSQVLVPQATAGNYTAAYGGVALTAPQALTLTPRGVIPVGPVRPISNVEAIAAGVVTAAPQQQSGAFANSSIPVVTTRTGAASLANVWAAIDARADASLLHSVGFWGLHKLQQLRGSSLQLRNVTDVACRVVGTGATGASVAAPLALPAGNQWICQLTVSAWDPSVSRGSVDLLTVRHTLLSADTAAAAAPAPAPAFQNNGAISALSTTTVLSWTQVVSPGLPGAPAVAAAPAESSPLTAAQRRGLVASLAVFGALLGLVVALGIADYYRRVSPARQARYLSVETNSRHEQLDRVTAVGPADHHRGVPGGPASQHQPPHWQQQVWDRPPSPLRDAWGGVATRAPASGPLF